MTDSTKPTDFQYAKQQQEDRRIEYMIEMMCGPHILDKEYQASAVAQQGHANEILRRLYVRYHNK
jgi:hypothetical protein